MAERRADLAARLRDRREPRRRADHARHRAAGGRGPAGRPGAASWRGAARPLRERAPRRRAEDLRARRSCSARRRAGGADARRQVLDGMPPCRREWGATWRASQWLPQALPAPRAAPPSPAEQHRGPAGGARRRAAALQHARESRASATRSASTRRAGSPPPTEPRRRRSRRAELPGQRFQVRCADLAAALAALSRADARMLEALAWRGTEGSATLARWRADQEMEITARHVTRRNPWSGIAGCIYLGRPTAATIGTSRRRRHFVAGARSVQRRLCGMPRRSGARRGGARRAADRAGRRTRPRRRGRRHALDGAAVAVHAAAAARVAAPAVGRALYPRSTTDARRAARRAPTARIASCSTARRSTSASRST